jgi:hypothetical protein
MAGTSVAGMVFDVAFSASVPGLVGPDHIAGVNGRLEASNASGMCWGRCSPRSPLRPPRRRSRERNGGAPTLFPPPTA